MTLLFSSSIQEEIVQGKCQRTSGRMAITHLLISKMTAAAEPLHTCCFNAFLYDFTIT